ncbi:MAG: hypothetical protein U0M00_06535 [Clostridia bacterium]|nr:hypothetical protein [Clostridia bacterium]
MSSKVHQKKWLSLTEEEVRLLESADTPTVLHQKILLKKAFYDGLNKGESVIPVHFDSPLQEEVKAWWKSLHGAYLSAKKIGEFVNWIEEETHPRPSSEFDFELLV